MAIETRPRVIGIVGQVVRRWQSWVWAIGLSASGYIIYLLVSGLLTPAGPVVPSGNGMVMRGIVSQGRHGTDSSWNFSADSSEISPDGYTTTYHKVHDATYFRNGKPTYRLNADTVTVDSRTENYSAIGGVHVMAVEGNPPDDLQTDDAYWNEASQTLTCTTQTRFVYRGSIMNTTHMTVNLKTGASQLGDTSIDYRNVSPAPSPTSTAPTSANR